MMRFNLGLIAAILGLGLSCASAPAAAPLKVVASFSILADMARQIGGERTAVTSLVGPDGDVHVYQPTASELRTLSGANVLVVNGLGLEGWLDRLSSSVAFRGILVRATNGVHPVKTGGADDPHAWQDVADAEIYARNIEAGIERADPAGRSKYRERLDRYESELAALDAWVREQIGTVPPAKRRIITSHDAFAYFGAAYGVEFRAPLSAAGDVEPSAINVAALVRQIRQEGTKALFLENMSDPRLLEQLARETGVTVEGELYSDALSGLGEGGETYIELMRHNVGLMVKAMARND